MATLLTIAQAVCDELGLDRPSAVASNSEPTIRQIYAYINREGRTLMKETVWPVLTTLGTISTVSGTSDYDYAADFDRLVDSTSWDRTNSWELIGPENPQTDRWRRESTAATTTRRYFRHYGSFVRINPTPTVNGDTLVYEYVSKFWCESAGGSGQETMTADTDVPLLDAQLIELGTILRFRAARGFDAQEAKFNYDNYKNLILGAQIGGGVLNMEPTLEDPLIDMSNIPDGGYAT